VLNPFNITLQGEIWLYQKIAVPLHRDSRKAALDKA
jgi:hypothetical protein